MFAPLCTACLCLPSGTNELLYRSIISACIPCAFAGDDAILARTTRSHPAKSDTMISYCECTTSAAGQPSGGTTPSSPPPSPLPLPPSSAARPRARKSVMNCATRRDRLMIVCGVAPGRSSPASTNSSREAIVSFFGTCEPRCFLRTGHTFGSAMQKYAETIISTGWRVCTTITLWKLPNAGTAWTSYSV